MESRKNILIAMPTRLVDRVDQIQHRLMVSTRTEMIRRILYFGLRELEKTPEVQATRLTSLKDLDNEALAREVQP